MQFKQILKNEHFNLNALIFVILFLRHQLC